MLEWDFLKFDPIDIKSFRKVCNPESVYVYHSFVYSLLISSDALQEDESVIRIIPHSIKIN